jgi:hypothetical protein
VPAPRGRYAEPRKSLTDPDKYLELACYEEAPASL